MLFIYIHTPFWMRFASKISIEVSWGGKSAYVRLQIILSNFYSLTRYSNDFLFFFHNPPESTLRYYREDNKRSFCLQPDDSRNIRIVWPQKLWVVLKTCFVEKQAVNVKLLLELHALYVAKWDTQYTLSDKNRPNPRRKLISIRVMANFLSELHVKHDLPKYTPHN